MKNKKLKLALFALTVLVSFGFFFSSETRAQRRDHLTEAETDLVREAQLIDLRTEVFVKAAERRFLALNSISADEKKLKKDAEKWGELPAGTRAELLVDIEKILQEAIDNIDNVAEHDAKSELFPKAVRTLTNAAQKFLPLLKSEFDKSKTEIEKGAVLGAIDYCNQIIEASAKLPKEEKKGKKKDD